LGLRGGGGKERKGEERIYPRSHLESPSFFVSKCNRTSAKGWDLKRGQREGELVGQGFHLGWFAKREKRKEEKKRGRKEVVSRISFEF
jgi:hypothetical protein